MTTDADATKGYAPEGTGDVYASVPFTSDVHVPMGEFPTEVPEQQFDSSRSPFAQPPDGVARSLHLIAERLDRIEQDNAREFGLVHAKLDWIGNAVQWLSGMLSGVQQVAAQMGGPMGSVVRKMMGGSSNG